jgi:poly(beta-D-mannuronate) lyase
MNAVRWIARLNALTLAVLLSCAGLFAHAQQPVRSPISPQRAATDTFEATTRQQSCPRPPPAIINHNDVVFYTDAANSVVSEELWRRRMMLNRPIRDFTAVVTRNADAYLLATKPPEWRATCAASWIEAWARDRAFLGEVSTWARYDTLWFGQISMGMAYLKIRHSPSLSAETHQRIGGWIAEVARAAISEQNAPIFRERLNNIRAWTAAAAAVAAVASNDRELLEYAVSNARAILQTVTVDGALPSELARGRRAFQYHVWALEPLALVALVAEANDVGLMQVNDGAFGRLVGFIIATSREPAIVARLAKTEQDPGISQWPRSWELGGMEMAQSLRPSDDVESIIAALRPIRSPFTGGDWSRTLGKRGSAP